MKIPSDVFCHPYNMNVVLQVFLAYNTLLMNVSYMGVLNTEITMYFLFLTA